MNRSPDSATARAVKSGSDDGNEKDLLERNGGLVSVADGKGYHQRKPGHSDFTKKAIKKFKAG